MTLKRVCQNFYHKLFIKLINFDMNLKEGMEEVNLSMPFLLEIISINY